METGNQIFREKSLKRVASPEELDNYIRVTNPSVWILLSCIIIFLLGLCAWGYFGRLTSTLEVYGSSLDGVYTVYVTGEDFLKLKEGMVIRTDEEEGKITSLIPYPTPASAVYPRGQLSRFGLDASTPLFPVHCDLVLHDGNYDSEIILEEIRPFELVFD